MARPPAMVIQKFVAYPTERICVFVITDTKTVWAEVIKQQRFITRYSSLNGGSPGHDAFSRSEDISRELAAVSSMHQLRHYVDADISVTQGSRTDLVVSIEHQNQRWSWEVDCVGRRLSSSILSKHLIVPLIVTSGFAFAASSDTPLVDQPAGQLQVDLDRVSKIAKRNPSLNVVQVLKRPRLTTSLQRVTAVINGVDADSLPPFIVDYDDMEEVLQDYTPTAHAKAEPARQKEKPPSPERTEQAASVHPIPWTSHPVSPPPVAFDRPNQKDMEDEDETMHTGPGRPGQAEKKDDSATESDSEPEDVPLGNARGVAGNTMPQSTTSLGDGESPRLARRTAHMSPESDSQPEDIPANKRRRVVRNTSPQSTTPDGGQSPRLARRKGHMSTDSDGASTGASTKREGSSRPQGRSGRGTAPRVKQPLKRGGRRL